MAKVSLISKDVAVSEDGGFCVRFTNGTGANSVEGTVVHLVAGTKTVHSILQNIPDPIGVIVEDGIEDGQPVWVCVSGLAKVLFTASVTNGWFARGFITGDTGYITGYALGEAVPTAPFASDKHFYEIGHIAESRTGAGLALVVLHFN